MSQNALSIANVAGALYRAGVNSALDTLLNLNSGAAAPGTTQAGMLWYDTANGVVKQRNAANSGWITRWTVANAEGVSNADINIGGGKFTVAAGTGNTTIAGTLNVAGNISGNISGTAASVTAAAQPAITSLGTLLGLTVSGGATTINGNFSTTGNANFTRIQDDLGNLIISSTNPSISSGFGVGAAILANNTAAFRVTIGTGSPTAGQITMPAAPNGWSSQITHFENAIGNLPVMEANLSNATTIYVINLNRATGALLQLTSGDHLIFQCIPY